MKTGVEAARQLELSFELRHSTACVAAGWQSLRRPTAGWVPVQCTSSSLVSMVSLWRLHALRERGTHSPLLRSYGGDGEVGGKFLNVTCLPSTCLTCDVIGRKELIFQNCSETRALIGPNHVWSVSRCLGQLAETFWGDTFCRARALVYTSNFIRKQAFLLAVSR